MVSGAASFPCPYFVQFRSFLSMPRKAVSIVAAGLMLVGAYLAKPASAAIIISVDWNSALAGIQSTIVASPGDNVTANIIFQITGASSISNYEMSTQFSSSRLTFISRMDMGTNVNPGLDKLPPTGNVLNNNQNTGLISPTLGLYGVNEFIAGSNLGGAGPTAADPAFSVSAITFRVEPGLDGVVLTPGIFPNGFDIFFSNGSAVIPTGDFTFNSGSITAVPEPSAAVLAAMGLLAVGVRGYRNRRSLRLRV